MGPESTFFVKVKTASHACALRDRVHDFQHLQPVLPKTWLFVSHIQLETQQQKKKLKMARIHV